MAREVLDIAAREIKPGVTTDHIDEVVHNACLEHDVRNVLLCGLMNGKLIVITMLITNSPIHLHSTTPISQSRSAHQSTKSFAMASQTIDN